MDLQSMQYTIVPSPHGGATRPLPSEFKELRRLCTEVGMPMERV